MTQPTLHRGKLARTPKIVSVRPLTREDMVQLKSQPRAVPRPKAMRETHHRMARLVAAGLRNDDILSRTGYSYNRLSTLRQDPAFMELVAAYREKVDEAFLSGVDEFYETSTSNMLRAERMIEQKLDDAEETNELPTLKDLMSLTSDRADRFGYGKKSTQRNENVDFAAMMEQIARSSGRSNVIDAKPVSSQVRLVPVDDDGGRDG